MKTAVGVVFTAALGTALPHVDKSTATLSSRDTESKLPWIVDKGTDGPCQLAVPRDAGREGIEEACGTERFCDMFSAEHGAESLKSVLEKWGQYGFKTDAECYAGHGKIPWVEYGQDYGACLQAAASQEDREYFEKACGTEGFCDIFNSEHGTDNLKRVVEKWGKYGYTNMTTCFAGHTKKPWTEYSDSGACRNVSYSTPPRAEYEKGCGTEDFCDLFNPEHGTDSFTRMRKRYGYATVADCIADHEPKP